VSEKHPARNSVQLIILYGQKDSALMLFTLDAAVVWWVTGVLPDQQHCHLPQQFLHVYCFETGLSWSNSGV